MTPALLSPRRAAAMALVALALTAWIAPAAQARIWVGLGVPLFVPPPVYYPPPPVYYAPPPPVYYTPPPPVTYTPPAYSPNPAITPAGQTCYAGPYTCPMERPVASGAACYCLSNGGQHVPGRAN